MIKDDGGFEKRESRSDRMKEYATMECAYCGEPFIEENPCWNDDGYYTNEDETVVIGHLDGECMKCAAKHGNAYAQRRIDAEPGRVNE